MFCRQISAADVPDMYAVYSDADAMRWVGDGQPITWEECVRWVDVTLNNYRTRGYGMSALIDRTTGATIGFIGLVHPGGQSEVEIKYALLRQFWGSGLATEAVAGMIGYAASELGITHIIATIAPENTASLSVVSKAGMRPTELRHDEDGTATQVMEWRA
jgi:ribosomal-protein-alanine N-acetyltransferase